MLLTRAVCRYLWIVIRLWENGDGSPLVGRIQIWFPAKSWGSYLPEYYQEQRYVNDKRRRINRFVLGAGIVAGLEQIDAREEITEADVWKRPGHIVEFLFQEELESGRYPEFQTFLEALYAVKWSKMIDVYQAWLLLLPILSENRKLVKKGKEP